MKKLILYALCMSFTYVSAAQTKVYVQLNGGAYTGKQLMNPTSDYDYGFGSGYNAGIAAGVVKNRWKLEAGISHLTLTGRQTKSLRFENMIDPKTGEIIGAGEIRFSERYSHIMVPVKISYGIPVGSRGIIAPFAGVAASYNYRHESKAEGFPVTPEWRETQRLGNTLVKWSAWGLAGVELGFHLNRTWQLSVNPEVGYMLNSFSKDVPVKQHTLIAGGNVCLRYFLR